jgi:hypothetical protein
MITFPFVIFEREHRNNFYYFLRSRAQFCCEMFTEAGDVYDSVK